MEFDGFERPLPKRPELFPLGQVLATPAALKHIVARGMDPIELLDRHVAGDWGNVPKEDARENKFSITHGFRILSSYGDTGERVWVITEADRSVTTFLLPEEY